MTRLTVVLTHYRRKDNALHILDSCASQTEKPDIFVWDNSPELGLFHSDIDWLIKSSKNTGCSMRWWFASQAKTKFVLIHDDDWLATDNRVLEEVVDAAERAYPYVVGVLGKNFGPSTLPSSLGVSTPFIPLQDVAADFVNGRFFCVPTVRLKNNWCMENVRGDDILMSKRLSNGKESPHLIMGGMHGRFLQLEEGPFSLRFQPNYDRARQHMLTECFPNATIL